MGNKIKNKKYSKMIKFKMGKVVRKMIWVKKQNK